MDKDWFEKLVSNYQFETSSNSNNKLMNSTSSMSLINSTSVDDWTIFDEFIKNINSVFEDDLGLTDGYSYLSPEHMDKHESNPYLYCDYCNHLIDEYELLLDSHNISCSVDEKYILSAFCPDNDYIKYVPEGYISITIQINPTKYQMQIKKILWYCLLICELHKHKLIRDNNIKSNTKSETTSKSICIIL